MKTLSSSQFTSWSVLDLRIVRSEPKYGKISQTHEKSLSKCLFWWNTDFGDTSRNIAEPFIASQKRFYATKCVDEHLRGKHKAFHQDTIMKNAFFVILPYFGSDLRSRTDPGAGRRWVVGEKCFLLPASNQCTSGLRRSWMGSRSTHPYIRDHTYRFSMFLCSFR